MKNSTKILIACGIVTALSTSILAAGQLMTIDVDPSIKILVDGEEFHPKDANGNDVMTFSYAEGKKHREERKDGEKKEDEE